MLLGLLEDGLKDLEVDGYICDHDDLLLAAAGRGVLFEGGKGDVFIVGVDGGVIEEDLLLLGAEEDAQGL